MIRNTYSCIYIYMHTYIYIYTYIHPYIHILYIYMCVYIYTYIHIYVEHIYFPFILMVCYVHTMIVMRKLCLTLNIHATTLSIYTYIRTLIIIFIYIYLRGAQTNVCIKLCIYYKCIHKRTNRYYFFIWVHVYVCYATRICICPY